MFYDGQFTLSTQLIILNYPGILSLRRSITVSLETFPLYSFALLVVLMVSARPLIDLLGFGLGF